MFRFLKILAYANILGALVAGSMAFSLRGPVPDWQTAEVGYDGLGGVMNLAEEYRWTIPEITYAFDPSFLNYFGERGVEAIDQAVAIINELPATTAFDTALTNYQLDTRRFNHQATALGLLDLKSYALAFLIEELGLTAPERYVWTLRAHFRDNAGVDFFSTIMRNFDPITWEPSAYVNGTLYSYQIFEIVADTEWEAVPFAVDPFEPAGTSVAGLVNAGSAFFRTITSRSSGMFFTGLTRDDVGGLRYIYRNSNYNVEVLYPNATNALFGAGNPWGPGSGTGTNAALVDVALRPGINEIKLTKVWYDSVLGQFTTLTNKYVDKYVTNGVIREQGVQLTVPQPHITFGAADLGVVDFVPVILSRTFSFTNNAALNSLSVTNAGPGQILPPVSIDFAAVGPYFLNVEETGQDTAVFGFAWGTFDGTTNAPIVYPSGASIRELESFVLSERSRRDGLSPWEIPVGTVVVQQGQGGAGGGGGTGAGN